MSPFPSPSLPPSPPPHFPPSITVYFSDPLYFSASSRRQAVAVHAALAGRCPDHVQSALLAWLGLLLPSRRTPARLVAHVARVLSASLPLHPLARCLEPVASLLRE